MSAEARFINSCPGIVAVFVTLAGILRACIGRQASTVDTLDSCSYQPSPLRRLAALCLALMPSPRLTPPGARSSSACPRSTTCCCYCCCYCFPSRSPSTTHHHLPPPTPPLLHLPLHLPLVPLSSPPLSPQTAHPIPAARRFMSPYHCPRPQPVHTYIKIFRW